MVASRQTIDLHSIASDATHYKEWCRVITNYLYDSRGFLFNPTESFIVNEKGEYLFKSESVTACLEWALQQPLKDK
jgi:hypothetical protein